MILEKRNELHSSSCAECFDVSQIAVDPKFGLGDTTICMSERNGFTENKERKRDDKRPGGEPRSRHN